MAYLHIVIVDYHKAEKVILNTASLLAQNTDFSYKITVVDNSECKKNASILQTQLDKSIECIINTSNKGYTKAYNDILLHTSSPYIAIVNPDIEWTDKNSLQKMVDYMKKNPRVGILAPEQLENGKHALTVRAFPKLSIQIIRRTILKALPWLKTFVLQDEYAHDFETQKIQNVPWVQSSCILTTSKLFKDLKGFNEEYFLFMSDTEYCLKAWEAGYRTVYFPKVQVVADGIRASQGGLISFFYKKTVRIHVQDAIRYQWNTRKTNFSFIDSQIKHILS